MNKGNMTCKKKKRALITGITGQDGGYLAELLIEKGYEVYGLIRRSSSMDNRKWIDDLDIKLKYGDLSDSSSIDAIIKEVRPDEVYNLAAQSHVGISFKVPEYTADVNAIGVIRLLEAIRKNCPHCRVYQASTSEMYGSYMQEASEDSPFSVSSPYGASKLMAHNICEMYREGYNMFICCGILFNHESPRRGLNFVTRKIVHGIVSIINSYSGELNLGNLDSVRDWGYAKDYVEAMWLMLQYYRPDDYVIATGETHTVKEFVEETCDVLNCRVTWIGYGLDEIGIIKDKYIVQGQIIGTVKVSPEYYRPKDVTYLKGNPKKAKEILGWTPKHKFKDLIKIMIDSEEDF